MQKKDINLLIFFRLLKVKSTIDQQTIQTLMAGQSAKVGGKASLQEDGGQPQ